MPQALPSCLPAHPNQRTFDTSFSPRRLFRRLVAGMGLYFLPAVYDQLAHDESEIGFDTKKPLVSRKHFFFFLKSRKGMTHRV